MFKERQREKLSYISFNPSSSIALNKLTAGDRLTTSGYTHQCTAHRITLWEGRDPHTYIT